MIANSGQAEARDKVTKYTENFLRATLPPLPRSIVFRGLLVRRFARFTRFVHIRTFDRSLDRSLDRAAYRRQISTRRTIVSTDDNQTSVSSWSQFSTKFGAVRGSFERRARATSRN